MDYINSQVTLTYRFAHLRPDDRGRVAGALAAPTLGQTLEAERNQSASCRTNLQYLFVSYRVSHDVLSL